MTPLLMPMLIFLAGMTLALPFFRTPPDDHFANYVSWALFRVPGTKLPAHYIQLNQGGFTRMFLYPLAVFVHDLVGRDGLLTGLRGIAASLNAAVGSMLYVIAVHQLGLAPIPAAVGALFYLFIATRPQYELLKYNPEIYQVAGETIGVWLLLALWPSGANWWPLALPVAWLVFVSLNCKILFGANVAAISLAIWLMSGLDPMVVAVVGLGGTVGMTLFFCTVRGASPKRLLALQSYLNIFARQAVWANLKWNYQHLYTRTPLLAYVVLSAASCLLGRDTPHFPIFVLWSVSSIAIVFIQKRFCSYFFLIAFAPLGFLAMAGLNRLYAWHPLLMLTAVIGLCWLGRASFREFFGYYETVPPRTLVERIHGSMAWLSSYDFRVEDVVAHHRDNPGPFMLWQTNLLAHYLTGQPPIVLAGTMIYDSQVMFPERQIMLIEAARREHPRWLYDFGGAQQGLLNFNPISFLLASGLMFVPRKRWQNIVYYELMKTSSPVWARQLEKVQLYVVGSVALDTLRNQLMQADIDISLPKFFDRDITDICRDLLNGDTSECTGPYPNTLVAAPGVAGLYAAAAAMARGNRTGAMRALAEWEKVNADVLTVFPALGLALFVLQLVAGRAEDACRWPEQGFAARTGVHEGGRYLELASTLLNRRLLSAAGTDRLMAIVGEAHAETDIYRYFRINEYNALLQTFTKRPRDRAGQGCCRTHASDFPDLGGTTI